MIGGATSAPICGRHAARDLLRNQHVGQQRPMRPVLLGRAGRHDHGVPGLEKRLDFRVGHFAEEYRCWFHDGLAAKRIEGR